MYEVKCIVDKLTKLMNDKVAELSATNPIILVTKPIITRAGNKAICKAKDLLEMIADENGMVDIEAILDEMSNNLIVAATKEYPDIFGGLTIGNSKIKMGIPFINKEIIFEAKDIEEFKKSLKRP